MDFKGKKIVVMGLGLHGGGLPVAQWFFSQGAEVVVTDLKKREELLPTIEKLDGFCRTYRLSHADRQCISIEYVLSGHREKDFRTADLVVQNPAVPKESAFLAIARAARIPIENETSLFFLLTSNIPKIGVTGTRGKSTTASLIYEMVCRTYPDTQLTSVALPTGSKGGFEALEGALEAHKRDARTPIVMELSSWQLEGLAPHHFSPNVAVMTNVYPDHLNRYDGMEEYIDAKKTIYRYQHNGDCAIFNYDNPITRSCGSELRGEMNYWFSRHDSVERGAYLDASAVSPGVEAIWMRDGSGSHEVCLTGDIQLRGEHNVENVLAAVCAAWAYGMSKEHICQGIAAVRGLPSRLELLGDVCGRTFYNDTVATSPEGTIAALKMLSSSAHGRIILIAGGSDKRLDYSTLAPFLRETVSHLILFTGTASPNIVNALNGSFAGSIDMAQSMPDAVGKAWQRSREGDIILLSPAAASFGLFRNEFDRGAQFVEAFSLLNKTHS